MYTALENNCKIKIIIPPRLKKEFHDAVLTKGFDVIDMALNNLHAEDATASRADDLKAIQQRVKQMTGGFDSLNAKVRGYLANWFQQQGGGRTATLLHANLSNIEHRGLLRSKKMKLSEISSPLHRHSRHSLSDIVQRHVSNSTDSSKNGNPNTSVNLSPDSNDAVMNTNRNQSQAVGPSAKQSTTTQELCMVTHV